MATITTTTDALAFEYPGSQYLDLKVKYARSSLFTITLLGTQLNVWRLPGGAGSWVVQPGMALTRAGIVELGAFFIDPFGYAHLTYRVNEAGKDRILYRRINIESDPNVWGAELLVAEASNAGTAGSALMGSDLVAVRNGSRCLAAIAVSFQTGTSTGVQLHAFQVATGSAFPSSTTAATTTAFAGGRRWSWTGSGYWRPSLDLQHTGDGHTSAAPHLWVTAGHGRSTYAKLIWGSGKWTGPSSMNNFDLTVAGVDYALGRWDGARFLNATVLTVSPDVVTVHERDSANTRTTIRATSPHPAGNIRTRALSYDSQTKDIRVWAVGTTTAVLWFTDYIRAAGTWTAWAQFDATALLDHRSYGVRRGSANDTRFDVYWQPASVSPYTLTHVQQALSYPPNLPGWFFPTPPSGSPANVAEPLPINWTFADPDPGDTQSAYAVSRQIGAGALQWWRASDSTWQPAEVKNLSTVDYLEIPPGWGASTDLPHNYRVKVWDSTDTHPGTGRARSSSRPPQSTRP